MKMKNDPGNESLTFLPISTSNGLMSLPRKKPKKFNVPMNSVMEGLAKKVLF